MAGQRRYPGATPFTSRQEKIFYGRDKDIEKLLTLIQVERKVLLYSKSGLGKTSLLEAGVLPKMPSNIIPVSIRLFAYKEGAETPVQRVINALKLVLGDLDAKNEPVIDKLAGEDQNNKTLWYYLKKAQLIDSSDQEGKEKTFLLFFDQFEELFSFPQKDIDEFKNQIYDLTELKVPDRYAVLIAEGRQNNRDLFNRETLSVLHKKIDTKTVFAIRSDRLSLLNKLSDKLPDIQNKFYELQPLDLNQAREAVIKPAADPDPDFETPPFTFHDDAINKIIRELSDGGKHNIETTQLQIVCHRVEEIAAEKKSKGPVQIEVEDLPEFKNIFLNFYMDSINKLPEEKRADANRLIEDELIRNQQRISLDEEICKEYLEEQYLRALVDTHLLRAERNTFGRFSFEVSHDTLVEPILESQKKYLAELEKIRLEEERQEELRKLREQQELEAREREEELKRIREEQQQKEKERLRKMRQQRTIIVIVSVFLIISIALGYAAYNNMLEVDKERKKAELALQNLKASEFARNYKEGQRLEENAQYQDAKLKYKAALELVDSLDVTERIAFCKDMIDIKGEYVATIAKADDHLRKREYIEAMRVLNKAYEQGYNRSFVAARRNELYRDAIRIFEKDLRDYNAIPDQNLVEMTRQRIREFNEIYNEVR
jgi:hypothetical protein